MPTDSRALGRLLNQSEKVEQRVEECATELALVNAALKKERKVGDSVHAVEVALAKSERIKNKVEEAAGELHRVNTELAREVAAQKVGECELADTKVQLSEARHDLSQSQAQEKDSRHLALHDAVTGLPNRALLRQRLDHGLAQAKRHGWRLAILFIDLDAFKSINDSHGHHVGDEVLLMVARRLQASVRAEDTVSRYGGDEFVCLLLDVKRESDVANLAQGMARRIAEPYFFGETVLTLTVSIGIALYPEDGEIADIILKHADTVMYQAKENTQKDFAIKHKLPSAVVLTSCR